MRREHTFFLGSIKEKHKADLSRWSYLEKNVDNVMWKLEEGLDMKTVKNALPQHLSWLLTISLQYMGVYTFVFLWLSDNQRLTDPQCGSQLLHFSESS